MFMGEAPPTPSQPQIFWIAKRFKHERDALRGALREEIERRQRAERIAEQLVRYARQPGPQRKRCALQHVRWSRRQGRSLIRH
jgi:hypothetical protein